MRVTAVVLAILACCAAPAFALPGDPPVAPVSPDDGATFAPDPDGIPVAFTCPVYRVFSAGDGFTIYGGPSDYGVGFATSPELGTDGRLRQDNVVALDTGHVSNTLPQGQCAATFAAGGAGGDRPQEQPGTYYWQVWRICTGCPSGYETGPVRTLVLRTPGRPSVVPPARAYAGFPAILGIRLAGAPTGARATLERRAGGRWRAVGTDALVGGAGEVIATLPRGRVRLRAVVRSGPETIAGDDRVVRVRPARNWRTRRADDGTYTGKLSVRFRVTGGGRAVQGFQADVPMLCPGLLPGQFTTQIGRSAVKRMRIAPDGSFVAAATYGGDTATLVRGRLARGRVTGRAELSIGTCSGSARFSAKR